MVKNQALNCHSGKQILCEIDSVCIHGDNVSSLNTAKSIKLNLVENGLILKPLSAMKSLTNDKKILLIFIFIFGFANYSLSASSSSNGSSKIKSDYEKAVSLIKSAKKYDKKGKPDKAEKDTKALKLLLVSNKKPNNPDTLNYLGLLRENSDFEKGEIIT